MLNNRVWISIT